MHTIPCPVLVVGPVGTPDDVANLRGLAHDVADQMGVPATYALHTDYNVTDFAAVYLTGIVTELRDAPTLVLIAEALAVHIDVYDPQSPRDAAPCVCGQVQTVRTVVGEDGDVWCAECRGETACAWCFERSDTEDLEIVESGDTWVPLHAECLEGMRRQGSGVLVAAWR